MSMLLPKIKVFIAQDSNLLSTSTLPETTLFDNNINIIGIENNINGVARSCEKLKPNVVLIYIENPNNLDFIPRLNLPIIFILKKSGDAVKSVYEKNRVVIIKPIISSENDLKNFATKLSTQITNLYKVSKTPLNYATKLIAIGASTGGTEAILEIIKDLPSNTCSILIVQHMPEIFSEMYAKRLDSLSNMKVREAKDNDRVLNGEVLIAAGGCHLSLCKDSTGFYVRSHAGSKVCGHCPSVDVLFKSVAQVARNNALGIILTGMGKDGAYGLLDMRKSGANTIGQNADSCIVYGMPKEAFNINAVQKELALHEISTEIINYSNKN